MIRKERGRGFGGAVWEGGGAGADLSLMTDVLTAGATQQVNVVQEQIYADADDRYWGGTR